MHTRTLRSRSALWLTVALVVGVCAEARAQTTDASRPPLPAPRTASGWTPPALPPFPLRSLTPVTRTSEARSRAPSAAPLSVAPSEGGYTMRGPRYATEFRAGGWEYTRTSQGSRSDRLEYRLARVAFGSSALFDAASSQPTIPVQVSATSVVYPHNDLLREIYSARHDGIAQSFTLGALQPGDLRITGTIETTLRPERVPGGPIQFFAQEPPVPPSAQAPRFSYGEPTNIDGTGKKVRGRVAPEGDSLAIVFREEQLIGLVAPLLVDPVIGQEIMLAPAWAHNPSLAWSNYDEEWLVVFDDGSSVMGQRIDALGALVGTSFTIASGSKPQVVLGVAVQRVRRRLRDKQRRRRGKLRLVQRIDRLLDH